LIQAVEMYHDWLDDDTMEDITLPGLAELKGYWRGSLDASGGGNGDTMVSTFRNSLAFSIYSGLYFRTLKQFRNFLNIFF
jgi:hypothetical protein